MTEEVPIMNLPPLKRRERPWTTVLFAGNSCKWSPLNRLERTKVNLSSHVLTAMHSSRGRLKLFIRFSARHFVNFRTTSVFCEVYVAAWYEKTKQDLDCKAFSSWNNVKMSVGLSECTFSGYNWGWKWRYIFIRLYYAHCAALEMIPIL